MNKLCLIRRIKYRFGAYRRKSDKDRSFKSYIVCVMLFMAIICCVFVYSGRRITSLALRMGEVRLENQIRNEFNRISAQLLCEHNESFENIVEKKYGDNNRINSMSIDFSGLNSFKCELTDELINYLSGHSEIVCRVPMGALISDDIFAAQGVKIPIKITSTGNVSVEFSDDFTSGGINQTRHRLMIKILAKVQLYTVLEKTERDIEIDIPVTEIITVGEVPDFLQNMN